MLYFVIFAFIFNSSRLSVLASDAGSSDLNKNATASANDKVVKYFDKKTNEEFIKRVDVELKMFADHLKMIQQKDDQEKLIRRLENILENQGKRDLTSFLVIFLLTMVILNMFAIFLTVTYLKFYYYPRVIGSMVVAKPPPKNLQSV